MGFAGRPDPPACRAAPRTGATGSCFQAQGAGRDFRGDLLGGSGNSPRTQACLTEPPDSHWAPSHHRPRSMACPLAAGPAKSRPSPAPASTPRPPRVHPASRKGWERQKGRRRSGPTWLRPRSKERPGQLCSSPGQPGLHCDPHSAPP